MQEKKWILYCTDTLYWLTMGFLFTVGYLLVFGFV